MIRKCYRTAPSIRQCAHSSFVQPLATFHMGSRHAGVNVSLTTATTDLKSQISCYRPTSTSTLNNPDHSAPTLLHSAHHNTHPIQRTHSPIHIHHHTLHRTRTRMRSWRLRWMWMETRQRMTKPSMLVCIFSFFLSVR